MEQRKADEVDTHVQEGELEPTYETLGFLDVGQQPSHVGRTEETERRKGHGKVEPVRSAVMQAPGYLAHSNTHVVVESRERGVNHVFCPISPFKQEGCKQQPRHAWWPWQLFLFRDA